MIRIVTERSSMHNNDEFVIFQSDAPRGHKGVPGRVVFFRAVTEKEIERGLDTSYQGVRIYEERPRLTTILDEIERVKSHLKKQKRVAQKTERKFDMVHALGRMLSTHHLSCMSGGCHLTYLGVVRSLLKKHNADPEKTIDLDYTVQDFYDEMDGRIDAHAFRESWLNT